MNKDISILGVKISPLSQSEAIEKIDQLCQASSVSVITTVNTEFIVTATKDRAFRDILNKKSKISLPDGGGLLWAAKFMNLKLSKSNFWRPIKIIGQWISTIILIPIYPRYFRGLLPERVAGADLIVAISKMAATKNYRVFLLGGAPTVAERAALKLQTDIYNLKISGVSSENPDKAQEIAEMVRKSKAEILLVAYGSPKQEKWLAENLPKTGAKVGIGVGGSFDFLAGTQRRAPKWMQKRNLEWLFRLISSPSRLKRQMALPKFLWLNLREKLKSSGPIS